MKQSLNLGRMKITDRRGSVDVDFYADEEMNTGEHEIGKKMDYGQFEKLIEWGQQWLKENPKKVEGFVGLYQRESPGIISTVVFNERRGIPQELHGAPLIACIPISCHIGEGLSTEEET